MFPLSASPPENPEHLARSLTSLVRGLFQGTWRGFFEPSDLELPALLSLFFSSLFFRFVFLLLFLYSFFRLVPAGNPFITPSGLFMASRLLCSRSFLQASVSKLTAPSLPRSCAQGSLDKSTAIQPLLILPRKEVIQPHLPIRLPCYDFTPVIRPAFDGSLLKG